MLAAAVVVEADDVAAARELSCGAALDGTAVVAMATVVTVARAMVEIREIRMRVPFLLGPPARRPNG